VLYIIKTNEELLHKNEKNDIMKVFSTLMI